MLQDEKAEGQEADNSKGIEMEGDFEGALEDVQADPDADDQEQDSGDEERLDQVCHCLLVLPSWQYQVCLCLLVLLA